MGSLISSSALNRQHTAFQGMMRLLGKVAAKLGGFGGLTSSVSDPTCDHLAGLGGTPSVVRGSVIRAGLGSYDCEVEIEDGQTIVCSALAPCLNDLYGASQACLPTPGSTVLVFVPAVGLSKRRVVRGVILGVVPENLPAGASPTGEQTVRKTGGTEFSEGGVSQNGESGPAQIMQDRKFPYKGEFQCGRPHDLVPGEYAMLNRAGAGLVLGALSTEIRGSGLSSLRLSQLDDQVRLTSGHFNHVSAAGASEIYNDEGYISIETGVSLYHSERLGVKNGQPGLTLQKIDVKSKLGVDSGVHPLKPLQTAKRRFYSYRGYLGDVINTFVSEPDPNTDVEAMDSGSVDRGLFHSHVGAEGRFTVRSAAGILLERYDRIPVPKRTHYAWDPSGAKAGSTTPEEKKGFQIPLDYPMAAGAAIADLAAWWNHLSYARFRQFGGDFRIPQQKELKCPDDKYDEIGKGTEEFQRYDRRHSYIGLTPDGGIVLRDAWGSEIVMADGRITISSASTIEIRSGESVVTLAGKDVVQKAYGSVDITATKKDVRLKAEGNLQAVSETKGILLQSKAKSDGKPDWSKAGEDLQSTGVVIKADTSSVALVGRTAVMQGTQGVHVAAFDEKGKPSGQVVLSGAQIMGASASNVIFTANGKSGVVVSDQSAALVAPSVVLVGGQSAGVGAGDKFLVGIPVDAPSMYSTLVSVCKNATQTYLNSTEWLNPFPPTAFSEIAFGYRTTKQYGTDRPSGLTAKVFSVYQPAWVNLAGKDRPWMGSLKAKAWDEGKDGRSEMPWPGKDAGSAYLTFKERNVDEKGLEDPQKADLALTPEAFSSYHIRDLN